MESEGQNGVEMNGHRITNGFNDSRDSESRHESAHKERRKETELERAARKERERKARENETEDERRIRKEKEKEEKQRREKESGRRKETEEERAARKEREKHEGRRKETDEERAARKERERKEKDEKRKHETDEERRARKDREKTEGRTSSHREHGERRKETEEERAKRKEKERREKDDKRKHETEEERRARKDREKAEGKSSSHRHKETEEERAKRKERERAERKVKEEKIKEERQEEPEGLELNEDYFKQEEERLARKAAMKEEADIKEEDDEDTEQPAEQSEEAEGGDTEDNEEADESFYKKEEPMEEESDEDVPLARRKKPVKQSFQESDDEDVPLAKRKKQDKKPSKRKMESDYEDEDDDYPKKKASKKQKRDDYDEEDDFKPKKSKSKKGSKNEPASPTKKMTKKEKELEAEKNVWKWWEEKKVDDGTKWKFLEHLGPLMAPDYEPLPPEVRFWYDGKVMRLSEDTEEVATFYGKMLDHDYTTKEVFNKNFFKDWRKVMTEHEKERIRDLSKCDFSEINEHFKKVSETRKARSKEEKNVEKEKNAELQANYGFCTIDGHKERIGNFRLEPPGLFRGRGEHPKQGMVKKRLMPEDIIINCSKDSKWPEPPPGHKWKKVQHDNTVTWLASWIENVQGQGKYIMLNPSSKLKGEKDMMKYEKARQLKEHIHKIREDYEADFKSKEMRVRQRSVALYFIDRLALRAGNEKDEDQADTVGCCSLRVEHVDLYEEKDGKEYVVEFDFLGKDSIRYFNSVPVEKRVFKNVKMFKENKKDDDDLFDRLNTSTLNQYLNSLLDGLTAKVFRTYNASFTLQDQLNKLTEENDNVAAKMLSYNRANREVAILCNHQRAVPKTHDKSMANLEEKLEKKQEQIKEAEKQLKHAKKAYKNGGSQAEKVIAEKKKQAVKRLLEQLEKLEIQRTDKDENKTIALGTSKLNYLDPRISVAWCKKYDVPIEKVYNKTQREKFMWAIDMAGPDYEF